MKVLRRLWVPLLIVVVVAIAGVTVHRIRGYFGSGGILTTPVNFADDPESFDPKVVTYEVFGNGTYANINYMDLGGQPQRLDGAALPWSLTLETTDPSVFPNIVAQGDSDHLTCRITIDGEVKDERTYTGVTAQTFCLVKSA
ncbi:MmpS family transport accessory protein [Mycolicibacterium palauense]|uniref:MmpS family transport accessory protein n=1 Tax=Mycolicibacterium palauense TaxID=2034511 RepID=UPI001C3F4B8E|nr:MmpS family transport accessory protein [Mycolicibacterium palauense]